MKPLLHVLSLAMLGGLVSATMLFAPAAVSSTAGTAYRPAQPSEPVGKPVSRFRSDLVVVSSDGSCPPARRKLWVDGEGWVVRRVAACR
jgi:hypothetical protein